MRENESDVLLENNAVIELDMERGTFMLRRGMRVRDFYSLGGKVYYTQADAPYDVMLYDDESASGNLGQPVENLWETAWMDLGKGYVKRDFLLRLTADADEDDVPIDLTLETERGEKTKTVLLQRERRDLRVRIRNAGKRVRLRVASHERAAGWRIYGGIEVRYTLDVE